MPDRFSQGAVRVDLRVGGGAPRFVRRAACITGRSPRGRRSRPTTFQSMNGTGSISAWAEEPIGADIASHATGVDLRVGGGASQCVMGLTETQGRSPRGRRSPSRFADTNVASGSISAWAEEPPAARLLPGMSGVDLRVGGGAGDIKSTPDRSGGRSPRGRRSRRCASLHKPLSGSISAWAEEPKGAADAPF